MTHNTICLLGGVRGGVQVVPDSMDVIHADALKAVPPDAVSLAGHRSGV